jgi:hypothetical protein
MMHSSDLHESAALANEVHALPNPVQLRKTTQALLLIACDKDDVTNSRLIWQHPQSKTL